MKQILETLAEEEPNATLLVDGDTRGKACEELNKELENKLNLLKLNDCDDFKNFKNKIYSAIRTKSNWISKTKALAHTPPIPAL